MLYCANLYYIHLNFLFYVSFINIIFNSDIIHYANGKLNMYYYVINVNLNPLFNIVLFILYIQLILHYLFYLVFLIKMKMKIWRSFYKSI